MTNPIIEQARRLDGWALSKDESSISRSFTFKDFKDAWHFMSQCAEYAEEINHHPEWFNVYNRVNVTLTTHDTGGLSPLDVQMATFMNTHAA